MIQIHLCTRGDVFVSEDGEPRWSPYGNDARRFYGNLRCQPHVTLEFANMADAHLLMMDAFKTWLEQALHSAEAYGNWPRSGQSVEGNH